MKINTILIICFSVLFFSCKKELQIVLLENAGQLEKLAASEIRKYIYLRSGELAVLSSKSDPGKKHIILQLDPVLDDQEFSLRTENSGKNKTVVILQ